MTTHEPFLAAIAAEPDEPGARLVYADWLEDQGDARAELIRVMEEMYTLAPYSDRFWELRPRRAQLKQGVSDEWLTALGYNAYRPLFTQMPAEREYRWRLITEFIESWHGPLGDSPGNTEEEIVAAEKRLGLRLPAAMREWYASFGKRANYWQGVDSWSELSTLEIRSGYLWIRAEDESNTEWGIDLRDARLEDPPIRVYVDDDDDHDQLAIDADAFSGFAALVLVGQGIWAAACLGVENRWKSENHRRRDVVAEALEAGFVRAALPDLYCLNPVFVWESRNIYCFDSQLEGFRHFAAHTSEAADALDPAVRERLEWLR